MKLFAYCRQTSTTARDMNEIIAYSENKQKYIRRVITGTNDPLDSTPFIESDESIDFIPVKQCLACVYGLRMTLSKCKLSHTYKEYKNGT